MMAVQYRYSGMEILYSKEKKKMNCNEELLNFLDQAPTAFHTIAYVRNVLKENDYEEITEGSTWKLKENAKYFVVRNESSVIAFRTVKKEFQGFMIGASHSDSPAFKIKENPEIIANGYVKLNVEGYGGMLMGPWLDRPLSVAGRVIVKEGDCFATKIVNVDRDLCIIPSLAIHMDRQSNSDHTWNGQTDMLPILGDESCKGSFMKIVAEAAGVHEKDIIGHDLFLYVREKGTVLGADKEYVSAPHLDDLQCGFGNLQGFLQASKSASIPMLVIFDNEEVGSSTKQGANSTFLEDTMHRIAASFQREFASAAANSFMVSADNAHAIHPNHPEKADPVNRPHMNQGIVLKFNANQLYTTDGVSAAVFRSLCETCKVPLQVFTNRSDSRGGSTLGNISNTHVSLNTVDIGLAQLAMHSCYETCGTKDTQYLITAMKKFFSCSLQEEGQGTYRLK